MGNYLNPDNTLFQESVASEIYIDKTKMIEYTNRVFGTRQKCICVSRPRRFGKSMTADMLCAYYSRGCDSKRLFEKYEIAQTKTNGTYMNQCNVIFLNMQEFLSTTDDIKKMIQKISNSVLWELRKEYPNIEVYDKTNIINTMREIYRISQIPFVVIIDEWDCVLREKKNREEDQRIYLDFLRNLLKDKGNIKLIYMTGILPIKKYGTHSALNMFDEFSMLNAGPISKYIGFTEDEVRQLCERYQVDFEETKCWYDGYRLGNTGSIYNPKSVVSCIQFGEFHNYWNQTESYEALKIYIDMNFYELKDNIIQMLEGEQVSVNVSSFSNDMMTFDSKDDVLTLLVHLGYLGYDSVNQEVFIPNNEISTEFVNVIRSSEWGNISKALAMSKETLKAIWQQNETMVAQAIENAHYETSHLSYNDENALSYTISLALYAARNYYTIYREMPTGKGYADLVYIPRKRFADKPALLVELKWDKTVEGAIAQIKRKEYVRALEEYHGNLLLVGINYEKGSRKHECVIEKCQS